MNPQILIDAIKLNLHHSGNAQLVEVALSALGRPDLGYQLSADMTRLSETIRLDQAESDPVESFMSGDRTPSKYSAEIERRTKDFWGTVARVQSALGIPAE